MFIAVVVVDVVVVVVVVVSLAFIKLFDLSSSSLLLTAFADSSRESELEPNCSMHVLDLAYDAGNRLYLSSPNRLLISRTFSGVDGLSNVSQCLALFKLF